MASESITLHIRPRGVPIRGLPEELNILTNAPVAEVYKKLAQESKFSVHRLKITKGSDGSIIPNSKDVEIGTTGLKNQSVINVKDLGPQIAWRTVFLVEYLGPLIIHPLIYLLRPYVYRSAPMHASQLQTLSFILICLHFLKRELETIFVHRFSSATMPASNIIKNSVHYWVLSGLVIAVFIYAPTSPTAKSPNAALLYPGLLLYAIGELGNFYTHLTLRGLRSSGGTERGIPSGMLFDLVTCPNYLTEIIAWIGVYLVSGLSWSFIPFLVAATVPMMQWASKKESRYRKDFPGKYKKKRYTMLPGIW